MNEADDSIWSLVDMSGGEDACWPWLGPRDLAGYGVYGNGGKRTRAHRATWSAYRKEPFPHGLIGRHACDNPPCVNPRHIIPGTHAENAADRIARGRSVHAPSATPRRGVESHVVAFAVPKSKLAQVRAAATKDGMSVASWVEKIVLLRSSGREVDAHEEMDRMRIELEALTDEIEELREDIADPNRMRIDDDIREAAKPLMVGRGLSLLGLFRHLIREEAARVRRRTRAAG